MKKYQRGGRSGKLHNMAMRMRKNKPERFNPFKENLYKQQLIEQMKILAQQNKIFDNLENEVSTEEPENNLVELPENVEEVINEPK